jgi:hypothetical protein
MRRESTLPAGSRLLDFLGRLELEVPLDGVVAFEVYVLEPVVGRIPSVLPRWWGRYAQAC